MLAGIEDVSAGEIYFEDRPVTALDAAQRNVAMVFEDYALYPHLTVAQNIAFPLEIRGRPRDEIRRATEGALSLLGLEAARDTNVRLLSGGAQQRVGIGRALVRQPAVILFDEPLSHLDGTQKSQLRAEIKRLQKEAGVTSVLVTHDQTEAMAMADRVAVMDRGALQQVGTADDLYERPANLFVAQFIGEPPMNLLPGRIERRGTRLVLESEAGQLVLPSASVDGAAAGPGVSVIIGIRPEHLRLAGPEAPAAPGLPGSVFFREHRGDSDVVLVQLPGPACPGWPSRSSRTPPGAKVMRCASLSRTRPSMSSTLEPARACATPRGCRARHDAETLSARARVSRRLTRCPASRSSGSASASAISTRSTTSASPSDPARSSASRARRARESPRCAGSSAVSSRPRAAMCASTACPSPGCRRSAPRRHHVRVLRALPAPERVRQRGFPARAPGVPHLSGDALTARVRDMLRFVELADLEARRPAELSGGQRQRVALSRALAQDARAYVLDEPISHLDAKLRHTLRGAIRRRLVRGEAPTIWTSPDALEVLAVADRVAVIVQGRVRQVGTPSEIYRQPAHLDVARLVGDPPLNLLEGDLVSGAGGLSLRHHAFALPLPERLRQRLATGRHGPRAVLGLRPAEIALAVDAGTGVAARVWVWEPLGQYGILSVRLGEDIVKLKVPRRLRFHPGDPVTLDLHGTDPLLFDAAEGTAL
jgi:ABC-type sugar transport system ATPase subunit